MPLIPRVMSTQHPDNVNYPPYAIDGVLKGEAEIQEAVDVFLMGCDEQMWDSEGKDADAHVVQKLLAGYPHVFREERVLGKDCILTPRIANPSIERDMRKSVLETLHGVPSAWEAAHEFYGDDLEPPIQEVILPFTTSAEEITLIAAYYRQCIVQQEDVHLTPQRTVREWIGDFHPKTIRVIPLIEDLSHMLRADALVEQYLRSHDVPYQRVFLARSDPALNYGVVPAELMLRIGLRRLYDLERRAGIPIYPIIGVGAIPFRGHLTPRNVERSLAEYPSVQTFTVQSAFKYDYPPDEVRRAIQQLHAHQRSEPPAVDESRAQLLAAKYTAAYQACVRKLVPVLQALSHYVPQRRERKLHVGLFGYGRTLGDGNGDVRLPRAIAFAAALYSIGLPPDILGLTVLEESDLAFVREAYPSFDSDLAAALRYANEEVVQRFLGDEYRSILRRFRQDEDRVHAGLALAVAASLEGEQPGTDVRSYILHAAALRHYLG